MRSYPKKNAKNSKNVKKDSQQDPKKSTKNKSIQKSQKHNHAKASASVIAPKASQIVVNNYSEEWLKKNFDIVYLKEILCKGERVQPGSEVEIISSRGHFLGKGIAGEIENTEIDGVGVRRYSVEERRLDEAFFSARFEEALFRRDIPEDTNAWRWVHAENDNLSGIVVEVWGSDISIILSDASLVLWLDIFVEALLRVRPFKRVWGHVRLGEGKQEDLGLVFGEEPEERIQVQELGIQYWVTPQHSKDAGLFCDMRALRKWLQARWRYKRVLNLFCYTGAFSVSAAYHGASEVHSVDLSAVYLERSKENFLLNGLTPEQHVFLHSDSFQALDRYRRKNEGFDIVIADPPSFSHSAQGTWSVQKDLKRLVSACLRVLVPGGYIIIATNHGKMSPREFSKAIQEAAQREGRRLVLMHNYCPDVDFPAALYFPEARYLKCWVMRA